MLAIWLISDCAGKSGSRREGTCAGAADAASGAGQRGMVMRSTRSELKVVTELDIGALRQRASDVARRKESLTLRFSKSTGQRS